MKNKPPYFPGYEQPTFGKDAYFPDKYPKDNKEIPPVGLSLYDLPIGYNLRGKKLEINQDKPVNFTGDGGSTGWKGGTMDLSTRPGGEPQAGMMGSNDIIQQIEYDGSLPINDVYIYEQGVWQANTFTYPNTFDIYVVSNTLKPSTKDSWGFDMIKVIE